MKRLILAALLLSVPLFPQTILPVAEPTPLQVTRVPNITSSATVIDNRSQWVGEADVIGFCATGSGTWTAALQYSDVAPGGPWNTPGSVSTVTSSSANCIGSYLGYHEFIRFLITGSASVNYTATKSFYPGVLNGNGATSQGPVGPPIPGKIPVSAYGVNGSSTDSANMQIGLNALAGLGCLYIPAGTTVNMVGNSLSLPSHTCLIGDGDESIIQSTAIPASGGVVNISSGTEFSISGVHFTGSVTSPTGLFYSQESVNGANYPAYVAGSSIYITGPADQISVSNTTIEHTAGDAIFSDNSAGNITNVSLQNVVVKNSRPFLAGQTSGQLVYGSWFGGILFYGAGTTYNYQNIFVGHSTFQNVVGNALWFHVGTLGVLNSVISITNNTCIDTGLDCVQAAAIDGYTLTGNRSIRNGYVVTSDVGATRVGGPMWNQLVSPVSFDNSGEVIHGIISNNVVDTENGEGFDGDGLGVSVINGNKVTSCFSSSDPLASASGCGPYLTTTTPVCPGSGVCKGSGLGQNNFVRGMSTSNSNSLTGMVGQYLSITGNSFDGVGGGGLDLFGINNSLISGNLIQEPEYAYYDPIVLGNLGTSQYQHSTGNTVIANVFNWSPPAGAPGVFEDGVTACSCPFLSSDSNTVKQNVLFGSNLYEFQKDVNDASGTSALWLSSATPGAPVATGLSIQPEGILASNLVARFYLQYNGYGEGQVFTMAPWGALEPVMNLVQQTVSAVSATQGVFWYCKDCIAGSVPCTAGGGGHTAVSDGSKWCCN